jgi:mycothiol synthase
MITMYGYARPQTPAQITPFDPATASAAGLAEYVRLELAASAVDEPAEDALTGTSALARLTRPPAPDPRRIRWVARDRATAGLVGVACLVLFGTAAGDLAAINITVHPGQRRRGTGTALLRQLAAAAGSRNSLFMENIRAGTAAQAFADHHSFAVVQQTVLLSLDLASTNRARWHVAAAAGYRLAQWTGAAPENLLVSYAAARNAISQAPRGDMSFTEPEWSPQRVRDEEAAVRARDGELRVVAAVHEQSGEVAGLTYLVVYQHRPELADQEDTAVLAAHRGRGLGAWMKAANLQGLAAGCPAVRRVRTSNAADNEHMLRVNRQVGFRVDATCENRESSRADLVSRLGS